MPSFFVHGYEQEVVGDGTCDRCERKLAGRAAYAVSYDGVVAKFRICAGCHSHIAEAFGVKQAPGGAGRPNLG